MKYEVIWQSKSFEFDNYYEALEYAKVMTLEEEKFDTALIFTRSKDCVKIQGVRWICLNLYELVNLTI